MALHLSVARKRHSPTFLSVCTPALALIALTSVARAEVATIDPNVVATLTDIVTLELSRDQSLDVLSSADLRRVVELEGERQAVGCSAETSCLAEVAGAMGARFVVFGHVGTLGETLVLNLNVFDSDSGTSAGRVIVEGVDAKALSEKMKPSIAELVARIHQRVDGQADGTAVRVLVLDLGAPRRDSNASDETAADGDADDASPVSVGGILLVGGGVVGAVGVVALAGGVVAGALALAADEKAKGAEHQSDAIAAYDERDTTALVANGMFLGGILLGLAGAAGALTGFLVEE